MPIEQNQTVLARWSESAPYWEKHRDTIREMFAPVTQALIEDAEIAERCTVLDVATGPGEPALTIAGVVGPDGNVVGTDPVAGMVEAARREAQRRGLHNASFELAFAESLPFPDGSFDVVACRFGAMFFPSPVEAIQEWLRVLKPGGKIALAVWHFADRNPFHYVLSRIVERHAGASPAAPDSADAFRFAEPGKLKAVLSEAGAAAPSERLLRFPIQARVSPEDFWALRREMSETLRSKLAVLSKQQMSALTAEVIEALTAYAREDGIDFSGEVLIVTAGKAAA